MSKEDNIREILNEAAQEIVQIQSNPRSWLSWMVYLLARLEDQATMEGHASREVLFGDARRPAGCAQKPHTHRWLELKKTSPASTELPDCHFFMIEII